MSLDASGRYSHVILFKRRDMPSQSNIEQQTIRSLLPLYLLRIYTPYLNTARFQVRVTGHHVPDS